MTDWMPESWDEDYRQVYALLASTQEEKRWWRRALYHACGGDHAKVAECMKATELTVLNRDGSQSIPAALAEQNSRVMSVCKCDPATWDVTPTAICNNFVPEGPCPSVCANCEHDEACHSTQNTENQGE